MSEQFCDVGRGITLCYESFGEDEAPPVLMIMGLSTQMIAWNEALCEQIVARGFRVIRFDNRDIGRSTQMSFPPPSLRQLITRRFHPEQYRLTDMAHDTVGLMDALGIESANLVGASMGGMIAQTVAIEHPQRARSLVSVMSNTGSRRTGQPAPSVYKQFLRRPAKGREAGIKQAMDLFRVIGSSGELRDETELRELIERSFDRGSNPAGSGRQLAAILASGSRSHQLRQLDLPTTVVHGTADRLIRPSGGRATAAAIQGAKLILIDDMGHDLPRAIWPRLVDAIADTAGRAAAQKSGAGTN